MHGYKISDCRVNNTLLQGALIEGKPVEGNLSVTFSNVEFDHTCHYSALLHNQLSKRAPPIVVRRAEGINTGGQLRFDNCRVIDDHAKNRSLLRGISHCIEEF